MPFIVFVFGVVATPPISALLGVVPLIPTAEPMVGAGVATKAPSGLLNDRVVPTNIRTAPAEGCLAHCRRLATGRGEGVRATCVVGVDLAYVRN